jgi:LysR family transcriptional regulator for metE and metH
VERIAGTPAPRLEVKDLRVALALASAGSTSKAAETLHLTQPAVSRALLSLEDKLGARLFERTARGLTVTPAGTRLLTDASRLLVELCDLEQRVRGEPPKTHVRVVCECYTAYHWLPSALAMLKTSLPHLTVDLAMEHNGDPAGALATGKVDVALLTTATPRGKVEQAELFSDEIVFVMSRTHPLASKKAITKDDLKRTTMLRSTRLPAGEETWFMRAVFGKAKLRLQTEDFPLTEAIVDVARAGRGVAAMSEWIASPHLQSGELVARRLTTGPLMRPWRLAWHKDHRDAALRLGKALAGTAPHPSRAIF